MDYYRYAPGGRGLFGIRDDLLFIVGVTVISCCVDKSSDLLGNIREWVTFVSFEYRESERPDRIR